MRGNERLSTHVHEVDVVLVFDPLLADDSEGISGVEVLVRLPVRRFSGGVLLPQNCTGGQRERLSDVDLQTTLNSKL